MREVTATEIKNNFGRYLDEVQKDPIAISRSGRKTHVMISAEEYDRLMKLEYIHYGKHPLADPDIVSGIKQMSPIIPNEEYTHSTHMVNAYTDALPHIGVSDWFMENIYKPLKYIGLDIANTTCECSRDGKTYTCNRCRNIKTIESMLNSIIEVATKMDKETNCFTAKDKQVIINILQSEVALYRRRFDLILPKVVKENG